MAAGEAVEVEVEVAAAAVEEAEAMPWVVVAWVGVALQCVAAVDSVDARSVAGSEVAGSVGADSGAVAVDMSAFGPTRRRGATTSMSLYSLLGPRHFAVDWAWTVARSLCGWRPDDPFRAAAPGALLAF